MSLYVLSPCCLKITREFRPNFRGALRYTESLQSHILNFEINSISRSQLIQLRIFEIKLRKLKKIITSENEKPPWANALDTVVEIEVNGWEGSSV